MEHKYFVKDASKPTWQNYKKNKKNQVNANLINKYREEHTAWNKQQNKVIQCKG